MDENIFTGISLEYIAIEAEGITEYNSIRWWVDGKEVLASDIEMVVYNHKED